MDKNTFKKLISYLESSSGKNTNHPMVNHGPNAGTSAMGEYALMPRTAQDLARQNSNKTELDRIVQEADPKSVEEILTSNPGKYKQYIDQLTDKVSDSPSLEEAATKWKAGQNASDEKVQYLLSKEADPRNQKMDSFLAQPGLSKQPTYVDQLPEIPDKEILFNKIRDRINMRND